MKWEDVDVATKEKIYNLMHLNWAMFQMGANAPFFFTPSEENKRMMDNTIKDFLTNTSQTPRTNHESWLKNKKEAGWEYAPVGNNELKLHPCILPWEELPYIERIKSIMSVESCKRVCKIILNLE